MLTTNERERFWPALPYGEWQATAETLHMWLQIVGKIRLSLTPWINHSWHVTLYLTARGLTTSPIPHGLDTFSIDCDFVAHELRIVKSNGASCVLRLRPHSVADFFRETIAALADMGIPVTIDHTPNELPDPIRFDLDEVHRSYEPAQANRFWRVLVQADRVFWKFRARFCGKCSPVHFFWGSLDLAVTRFSGRAAPPHPGGVPHLPDSVAREAYAQEVSSLGFWPGNAAQPTPIFYSYAYPPPAGFAEAKVQPAAAFYSQDLREFVLPYDAVREADSPDEMLLAFAQSSYDAASLLGNWEREKLDEATLHPPAR